MRWAVAENGGYLSLADIQARGWGKKAAERLAAAWEARGWLAKDTSAGNKRRITEALGDQTGALHLSEQVEDPPQC